MRRILLVLMLAACAEGDCPPIEAERDGLRVMVTPVGGCGGGTWSAQVTFPDGRTQTLAGERDGAVTAVQIQDVSGDGIADIVVLVERDRRCEFIRQGSVFFGREIT
ncbi:MAG: hypothetical protein WD934_09115 [Gemmatimonadales bacterium]